ncbi:MAG TPA: DMT family transporter [Candidatus Dormibacteraeota bacterium]|nr:DMT family transporter [Candidatus Dormibacteraeota bacterium]
MTPTHWSAAVVAVPVLFVVGGLLAVQTAANVQLSTALGSPMAASTLQLAIGATLFLAVALAVGTIGAIHLVPDVTPWHLAGGVASALYVSAGILLLPRLGAVVTVGMLITGQMLASLLLDAHGLLGVAARHVGLETAVGLAGVLLGAALIVRAQGGTDAVRRGGAGRLPWLLLAVVAGACLPVQGAINAQLRLDLQAPFTAGFFSFTVATAAATLVLLLRQTITGAPPPALARLRGVPWWGWAGGFAGATYVISVFLLIPVIGAAPTVALTVGGQQVASIAVDSRGLLRLPRRPITGARLTGAAVLLAGVGLLQVVR